jgi:hypothetical protein
LQRASLTADQCVELAALLKMHASDLWREGVQAAAYALAFAGNGFGGSLSTHIARYIRVRAGSTTGVRKR